jgi:hypothetical protein
VCERRHSFHYVTKNEQVDAQDPIHQSLSDPYIGAVINFAQYYFLIGAAGIALN